MPLFIKDDATADLVAQLARLRGTTKQAAVKQAVRAELHRAAQKVCLRVRFSQLRDLHPLPEPTGLEADKAFFDALSATP